MKTIFKLKGWISLAIGAILMVVGIVMLFVTDNVCNISWQDWYYSSMPFILFAIAMRVFYISHKGKKKEET